MSRRWTHSDMTDRMIELYSRFPYQKRVEFLRSTKDQQHLSTTSVSNEEIFEFFRSLLDATGIISATDGNLQESFQSGDLTLLGRRNDIRGVFSSPDDNISDWMCSTLFQGWVRINESGLKISKDLRYRTKDQGRVCDFLVTHTSAPPTLVECKRIHPAMGGRSITEIMSKVKAKALDKTDEARAQFANTEKFLGNGPYYRLVVLDISSYGDTFTQRSKDMSVIGFKEKPDIYSLVSDLQKEPPIGIDEICVCWSNLYYFKGAPRILAYYTKPLNFSSRTGHINYQGWTVEFYPRGKNTEKYKELRVSNVGRSSSFIITSWKSATDNLITYGPEEHKVK